MDQGKNRTGTRQPACVPLEDALEADSVEDAVAARMESESALEKLDPQDAEKKMNSEHIYN